MTTKAKKWLNADVENLFAAILALKNLDEIHRFLRDLMTENEIAEFANRWRVARMLSEKVPYKEIEEKTGMSSTTIARIQKWVKRGEGGYRFMIERMQANSKSKK